MNFKKFTIGVFLFALFLLPSCHKDNPTPTGEFSSGIFVINEGNFGNGDGTISFYNPSAKTVEQDIYGAKNAGKALGDVVQSMLVSGDKTFVVVNNSNKMEIVNSNTFVSEGTITGLSLPRFAAVAGTNGYITEWVNYTDPGRVTVFSLSTNQIQKTIATDYGSENIMVYNSSHLFVSNSFSNTLSTIDTGTGRVTDTIFVSSSPGAFVLDKQKELWVICGGGYDINYNPLNDGALVRLNPDTHLVDKTIALGMNVPIKMTINEEGDKIFFFDDTHVYAVNITDTTAPASPLITESAAVNFYGIGVDPATDIIYVGDSKAFATDGVVYRYTSSGVPIDNFPAGRGPNGFIFK
jgi:YVTN family beta-propeller protein